MNHVSPRGQKELNAKFIDSDFYHPSKAVLLLDAWTQLEVACASDLCTMQCLEQFGDPTLSSTLTYLQRKLVPGQCPKIRIEGTNGELSIGTNKTLLTLCRKLRVDFRRLDEISRRDKSAGNAFELLSLFRPEASVWMEDIFGPLILFEGPLCSQAPRRRSSKENYQIFSSGANACGSSSSSQSVCTDLEIGMVSLKLATHFKFFLSLLL
ncbi:hypothetical protein R3P38DRAFT_3289649 [Favolaschia claudopus]|uniref:Uncharacterized protein n=1 Tax=Favolaschia claudopus TaxID=2862362 RepID=A0AAV9ZU19_9AGAR